MWFATNNRQHLANTVQYMPYISSPDTTWRYALRCTDNGRYKKIFHQRHKSALTPPAMGPAVLPPSVLHLTAWHLVLRKTRPPFLF
jgi:hypothetical protein